MDTPERRRSAAKMAGQVADQASVRMDSGAVKGI